jgi:hypothetical protein
MPIFSAPEAEKRRRKSGVFLTENSDRTLDRTRSRVDLRVRSAQVEDTRSAPRVCDRTLVWPDQRSDQFTWTQRKGARPARPRVPETGASGRAPRGAERGVELIRHAARPVTCDSTRPIARGALWTLIERRVQRVRSNGEASSVTATALTDSHCYYLSYSDRTCLVTLTCASGHLIFHCDV